MGFNSGFKGLNHLDNKSPVAAYPVPHL